MLCGWIESLVAIINILGKHQKREGKGPFASIIWCRFKGSSANHLQNSQPLSAFSQQDGSAPHVRDSMAPRVAMCQGSVLTIVEFNNSTNSPKSLLMFSY